MQHLQADMSGYERACELLRDGEVVAFPTEVGYALAVNALDEGALGRLTAVRAGTLAPTVIVSAAKPVLDRLLLELPRAARRLMDAYWPGALTLVLPARASLPAALVDGGYVTVREAEHPVARSLVESFGGPLTAVPASAGELPAPRRAADVHLAGVAAVIDGGEAGGELLPSLVRVDAEGRVETLRPGPVSVD